MKKLSFLMFALAATMMLSAQTFQVTWNLDGGVTNQYGAANKSELFTACMADAGVTTLGTLEELKASADPYTTICTPLGAAQAQAILDNAKWD
ncbi:MAG: hypothetical protein IIU55_08925, partial [Paludibacteraceae bacterium]|nr:hypothetical protein [Paludibacteraceae bacterium]